MILHNINLVSFIHFTVGGLSLRFPLPVVLTSYSHKYIKKELVTSSSLIFSFHLFLGFVELPHQASWLKVLWDKDNSIYI